MMSAGVALPDELNQLLRERGWRYRDVVKRYPDAGRALGLPCYLPGEAQFSRWRHGKHLPGPYHTQVLAAIFEIPVLQLLDGRHGHVDSDPVERRTFVRRGAGLLVGA